MKKITFEDNAFQDFNEWVKLNKKVVLNRIGYWAKSIINSTKI